MAILILGQRESVAYSISRFLFKLLLTNLAFSLCIRVPSLSLLIDDIFVIQWTIKATFSSFVSINGHNLLEEATSQLLEPRIYNNNSLFRSLSLNIKIVLRNRNEFEITHFASHLTFLFISSKLNTDKLMTTGKLCGHTFNFYILCGQIFGFLLPTSYLSIKITRYNNVKV